MMDAMGAMDDDGFNDSRRTRLANERTYLAWWRTGLGAYGVALATGRILPDIVGGTTWPYAVLGVIFALLGALVTGVGWWHYRNVNRHLSGGEDSNTPPWVIVIMSVAGVVCALAIAALIAAG
jgi:putative membrane protein